MTRNTEEFVNQGGDCATEPFGHGPGHVAVLLALYNGAAYLGAQLESLTTQTHRDWSLILSDDGSADDWLPIVVDFASTQARSAVRVVNGPKAGFAANFVALAGQAGPTVPYAAFCDQDDVWLPDKLHVAVRALRRVPAGVPALYCGRTVICDAGLTRAGLSPRFTRQPGFQNALVQNIGGGNTMVLNRAALDLLQDTAPHAGTITSHDWWTYQLVTGAGGMVVFDPDPQVLYRQHGQNRIGANSSARASLARLAMLLAGRFRDWNAGNLAALEGASHWLTPDARATLAEFQAARSGHVVERLAALHRAGLYRQTARGTLALWLAALLGRL